MEFADIRSERSGFGEPIDVRDVAPEDLVAPRFGDPAYAMPTWSLRRPLRGRKRNFTGMLYFRKVPCAEVPSLPIGSSPTLEKPILSRLRFVETPTEQPNKHRRRS
jgi:hypothetical protein